MMVPRPALPHWPRAGSVNAAKLQGCPGGASSTGNPVALARTLPVMPVPVVVERAPPTTGVTGAPLETLRLLVKVQYLIAVPFQPFTSLLPRVPPVESCQLKVAECVRLVLAKPRSAEVSR